MKANEKGMAPKNFWRSKQMAPYHCKNIYMNAVGSLCLHLTI